MSTRSSNREAPPINHGTNQLTFPFDGMGDPPKRLEITLGPGTSIPGYRPVSPKDGERAVVLMTEDEVFHANLDVLFESLGEAGIDAVEGYFDGYDDSGQIEDFWAIAVGERTDVPSRMVTHIDCELWRESGSASLVTLSDAIEYILFEHFDGGWEIGLGGEGEFRLDVANRKMSGELFIRGDYCDAERYAF
ncbi:DUF6878 family protein [Cribrihabitans sp. XS_ASV171]